jgi:hypothetical protein
MACSAHAYVEQALADIVDTHGSTPTEVEGNN